MMEATGGTLAVALVSAAVMGAAIQRGATCMVAAVDEAISERRYGRSLALAEAALWVGGLVAFAQAIGVPTAGVRYEVNSLTVLGGALLGLGAWINRACVFGAVARIGSGQLAWLGTPVGFFFGSLIPLHAGGGRAVPQPFSWPSGLAVAFIGLVLWRVVQTLQAKAIGQHLWHPHRATLLIAMSFFSTMLTVGLWAYTDALADLARAMSAMGARLALRSAMVLALLAGAIAGGWLGGKLNWQSVRAGTMMRCVAGGALMGAGALMVPGSNDGLIMLGLPLLQPYAWVAVGTMTAVIAAAITLTRSTGRFAASASAMDR